MCPLVGVSIAKAPQFAGYEAHTASYYGASA